MDADGGDHSWLHSVQKTAVYGNTFQSSGWGTTTAFDDLEKVSGEEPPLMKTFAVRLNPYVTSITVTYRDGTSLTHIGGSAGSGSSETFEFQEGEYINEFTCRAGDIID